MNKSDIISKIDKEERERKEKERQEKKIEKWRDKHWRQYRWGDDYNRQTGDYKKGAQYEYAIWYYHKRFRLLNFSLIPFAIATFELIAFMSGPSFSSYFWGAICVGLSRAMASEGDEGEKEEYNGNTYRRYNFFRLSGWDRFGKRRNAFLIGVLLAPLCYLYHIYDYLGIALFLDNPSPPVPTDYGSGEVKIGRVDQDGNIYKST